MSLKVYDLTHTFTQFMPEWPSTPGVNIDIDKFHARDGVYQVSWDGIMHRGTHMDAPPSIGDYPLWRLFGTGVCVNIPMGKWGVITPEALEKATPKIQAGDVVVINTGYHHKWADTDEYFAYGPGINKAGAQWLVDKKVRMVAYGCQANDHPIATKLVNHGLGPTDPRLIDEYKAFTGHDALEDFPEWEPAHKTLMVKGGIPGIENAGGALDAITGKRCTFMAFPWRWPGGDGCIVRLLALVDTDGTFRFETGK
jgi:kynurenine formamidase